MRVIHQRSNRVVAGQVEIARSLVGRLVGLIGSRNIPWDAGLVIPGCRQVHTFFMRFPIDVIFVDQQNTVVCAYEHVPPYRLSGYCPKAVNSIELSAGVISTLGIVTGDVLLFED